MEKKNIEIGVPPKAAYIIDALQAHGFEGYVVGGCVRDAILGRTANDWDITTPALPDDIHRIFPHTVDTGVAHGTVTVLVDREPFEVTTYRIDGVYEDGRHPREVFFTPRLSEDLRRRDFTINAMAWSRRSGLVDLFGGMEDLQAGLIRCVGEPRERIGEDALRMMRAVRFAAQLGFALEEGTAEAVAEMAPSLAKISAERICAELVKLLVSGSPEMIDTARQLGLTAVFLPEFDALFDQPTKGPHHDQPDVGRHTLKVLMQTPPEKTLRLAALLHDVGKPATAKCSPEGIWSFPGHAAASAKMAGAIMRRLRFDRDTADTVDKLIRFHSCLPAADPASLRCFASKAGPDLMDGWFALKRADVLGQSESAQKERLPVLERLGAIWKEVTDRQDPLTVRELALSGTDLIRAGMRPGREIGLALEKALAAVLEDPAANDRDKLLAKLGLLPYNET